MVSNTSTILSILKVALKKTLDFISRSIFDCSTYIITSQGGMSRYHIPKSVVERCNDAEVILKQPRIALSEFKI